MRWTQKPPLGAQIDFEHPLSRGLVGCWLMNEGSGNQICNLSGNGKHGSLVSGLAWKPGWNGQAVEFGDSNDYAIIYSKAMPAPFSFSISFLLMQSASAAGKHQPFIFNTADFRLFQLNPNNLIYLSSGGGARYINWVPTPKYWHTLICSITYLGTNNTGDSWQGSCYGDNKLRSVAQNSYITSPGNTYIFGSTNPAYLPTAGMVSDVRIWNRALSAQEVSDLYSNPYGFIRQPRKYWLVPQGVMIPPGLFFRRAA